MIELPRKTHQFYGEIIGAGVRCLNYKAGKLGNDFHGELSKDGKNRYNRLRDSISGFLPETGPNGIESYIIYLNWFEKRTLRAAFRFVKKEDKLLVTHEANANFNQFINQHGLRPTDTQIELINREVAEDIGNLCVQASIGMEQLGYMP